MTLKEAVESVGGDWEVSVYAGKGMVHLSIDPWVPVALRMFRHGDTFIHNSMPSDGRLYTGTKVWDGYLWPLLIVRLEVHEDLGVES